MLMDKFILPAVVILAWVIQSWRVRRRLERLNRQMDAILKSAGEPDLDFFRSKRLRAYLSTARYVELITSKAMRMGREKP